jgi:hypothetical protein
MATVGKQTTKTRPFAPNSVVWQKRAGVPVWGWLLMLLGGLLLFAWWRRSRQSTGTEAMGYTWPAPGDQTPPPVFIVPQAPTPPVTVPVTVIPHPAPGDGNGGYPGTHLPQTIPNSPGGAGSPPPSAPPGGGGSPTPTPPGGYVLTSAYPDPSVPRESTLWDIAGTWLPAGAAYWQQIWQHPLNAQLAAQRGQPKYIKPGDRWFVPNKLATPRSSY